ncbi:MAG: InlB B-repeat-containing protein, partial [Acetatifactor sp.]|nr:InlB B-repeat-containing protein [Acetatifactor sp.]
AENLTDIEISEDGTVATVKSTAGFNNAIANYNHKTEEGYESFANVTTIKLGENIVRDTQDKLPDGITIDGDGHSIQGHSVGVAKTYYPCFILDAGSVAYIKNIEIIGHNFNGTGNDGGAVQNRGGNLLMTNVWLHAGFRGINNQGNLMLKNCNIASFRTGSSTTNCPDMTGAGIYSTGADNVVVLDGCSVYGCSNYLGDRGGPAINIAGTNTLFIANNTAIIGNSATVGTGGLGLSATAKGYLLNCTFAYNKHGKGSGVFEDLSGGTVDNTIAVNCLFVDGQYQTAEHAGKATLYNCVHGTLNANCVTNETDKSVSVGGTAAKYTIKNGANTLPPIFVLKGDNNNVRYMPVHSAGPAATGGTTTYFDATFGGGGISVYAGFDVTDATGNVTLPNQELVFLHPEGTAAASKNTEVKKYFEDYGSNAESRENGVIGASTTNDGTYYAITLGTIPSGAGTVSNGSTSGTNYVPGQKITLKAVAGGSESDMRSMYLFDKWVITDTETGEGLDISTDPTYTITNLDKNITATPEFIHAGKITFSANGGSFASGNSYSKIIKVGPTNTESVEAVGALPEEDPVKDGYTFVGWTTTSNGDAFVEEDMHPTFTYAYANTYYAKWRVNSYTVHFDDNGKSTSGEMADEVFEYGQTKNLTACGFSRVYTITYVTNGGSNVTSFNGGANFSGWNTEPGGSGTAYSNSQRVSNLATEDGATITLYAQWAADRGTTLPRPTKSGATFYGWYTDEAFTEESFLGVAGDAYTPDSDVTLYARWGYVANFYVNGGTGTMASQTIPADGGNLNACAFTPPAGKQFVGWNTNQNGSGTPYEDEANVTLTGNTNFFAQWEYVDYEIAYELDGGIATGNPTSYNLGDGAIVLNNPTKEGFVFTGWSGTGLTGENNILVTIPAGCAGTDGDRSYVAHWRELELAVTIAEGNYVYNKAQITPGVTVKDGENELTETTDYTVSYGININAGENAGSITITGAGDYTGLSTTVYFDIASLNVENPTVVFTNDNVPYTGAELSPEFTVYDDEGDLITADEYTVSYENNVNIGTNTASVTITDASGGNYIINTSAVFSIIKGVWTQTAATVYAGANVEKTEDLSAYIAPGGSVAITSITDGIEPDGSDALLSSDCLPSITSEGILNFRFKEDVPVDAVAVITITVSDATNYADYELAVSCTVTNKLTQDIAFEQATIEKMYGSDAFANLLTGACTEVAYMSSDDAVATVSDTGVVTVIGIGSVTITATAEETDEYTQATASFTLMVVKATSIITGLGDSVINYTGAEQALVADITTQGGTIYYAIGEDRDAAPEDNWSTEIPTATEEGDYFVWCKVVGNANWNDAEPVCVKITIKKEQSIQYQEEEKDEKEEDTDSTETITTSNTKIETDPETGNSTKTETKTTVETKKQIGKDGKEIIVKETTKIKAQTVKD